jgi:hypothetical protein
MGNSAQNSRFLQMMGDAVRIIGTDVHTSPARQESSPISDNTQLMHWFPCGNDFPEAVATLASSLWEPSNVAHTNSQ